MTKIVKYSFYRPHRRVTEDNLYNDPVSGELTSMPSMTKQEFQHECDINNVIKAFKPHEMMALMQRNANLGNYVDLPDSYDFQEALHLVKEAEARFLTVPAKVRDRFGQDPAQFLAFLNDDRNRDEAIALGLVNAPPLPAAPVEVKIVNTDATTGGAGGSPPAGGAKAP